MGQLNEVPVGGYKGPIDGHLNKLKIQNLIKVHQVKYARVIRIKVLQYPRLIAAT